jgi:hypothetical protein
MKCKEMHSMNKANNLYQNLRNISNEHFMINDIFVSVGQALHIINVSRSQSDTPHSVGLLWTCDQPQAETWQSQQSQETDIHAPSAGFETKNSGKLLTAEPRLRLRGDCYSFMIDDTNINFVWGWTLPPPLHARSRNYCAVNDRGFLLSDIFCIKSSS